MTPLDKHKEAALTLWRDKLGFRNDRFGVIDTISAFIATLEAATEARVRRECADDASQLASAYRERCNRSFDAGDKGSAIIERNYADALDEFADAILASGDTTDAE